MTSRDKHAGKCRSCEHYDLAGAQNKAGAVMPNVTARCLWRPTEDFLIPVSAGYTVKNLIEGMTTHPERHIGRTEPNTTGCPCWEART